MKAAWILLLAFSLSSYAFAKGELVSLGLQDALRIAFEKSPDLKSAEARVQVARGIEEQARSQGGPVLTAHGFLMTTSKQTMIPSLSGYDPMAMIMTPPGAHPGGSAAAAFPIFTGGRVSGLISSATASREGEAFRYEAAKLSLAYGVKIAYFRVLAASASVDSEQDNLKENEEALRRIQALLNVGKVPGLYLFRAKAEVSEARRRLLEAQNNLELRKVELLRVLGLEADRPVSLTDVMPEPTGLPQKQTVLEEARSRRPEILAQEKEIAAGEGLLKSVKGNYYPQVYFYGRADILSGSPGQFNGTSFGLVASYPLFDSGKRDGEIKEAEGKLEEANSQAGAVVLDVSREVTEAWLNLSTAKALFEEAVHGLESAREDLRVTRLRFESGKGIQLELLDAIAAYTRARLREVEARFAYCASLADLQRAAGKLDIP